MLPNFFLPLFLQWYPFHRQLIYNCCFIPSFQTVNCDACWLSMQNSQSYCNHIKEIACVDRISKMTEPLYHSTIRLRAFKGLDYWWIDCGCVHTCQMDIACQQYFYISFVFVCKIMLLFVFSVDDELQHLYSRDTSCSTQQSRSPHNILILWGWTTACRYHW